MYNVGDQPLFSTLNSKCRLRSARDWQSHEISRIPCNQRYCRDHRSSKLCELKNSYRNGAVPEDDGQLAGFVQSPCFSFWNVERLTQLVMVNHEGCGRNRLCLISLTNSETFLERLSKDMKNLNRNTQHQNTDLKLSPLTYKTSVLTIMTLRVLSLDPANFENPLCIRRKITRNIFRRCLLVTSPLKDQDTQNLYIIFSLAHRNICWHI